MHVLPSNRIQRAKHTNRKRFWFTNWRMRFRFYFISFNHSDALRISKTKVRFLRFLLMPLPNLLTRPVSNFSPIRQHGVTCDASKYALSFAHFFLTFVHRTRLSPLICCFPTKFSIPPSLSVLPEHSNWLKLDYHNRANIPNTVACLTGVCRYFLIAVDLPEKFQVWLFAQTVRRITGDMLRPMSFSYTFAKHIYWKPPGTIEMGMPWSPNVGRIFFFCDSRPIVYRRRVRRQLTNGP